jgi:hypothetical protein
MPPRGQQAQRWLVVALWAMAANHACLCWEYQEGSFNKRFPEGRAEARHAVSSTSTSNGSKSGASSSSSGAMNDRPKDERDVRSATSAPQLAGLQSSFAGVPRALADTAAAGATWQQLAGQERSAEHPHAALTSFRRSLQQVGPWMTIPWQWQIDNDFKPGDIISSTKLYFIHPYRNNDASALANPGIVPMCSFRCVHSWFGQHLASTRIGAGSRSGA